MLRQVQFHDNNITVHQWYSYYHLLNESETVQDKVIIYQDSYINNA